MHKGNPDTALANRDPGFSIFACGDEGLFLDFRVPTGSDASADSGRKTALTTNCSFWWGRTAQKDEPLLLNDTLCFLFIYFGGGVGSREREAWRAKETRRNVYKTGGQV